MMTPLPLIIEPQLLSEHLDDADLLIVDLCSAAVYAEAHLPGAIHVEPAELISGVQPATGKLPGAEKLNALFRRIGYQPNKQIIAYDDEGGGWAGRFIWTLDVIGHQRSAYLNGGLVAWMAEGRETTRSLPQINRSDDLDISIDTAVVAAKDSILASLDDPDTVIWDARSAEEFHGLKVVAAKGGHIPGAINMDWLDVMDRDNALRIREDIAEQLHSKGITADKRIITHCQTHHRSGLTYLVGKSLGYQIKAYDGSWSEWGNDPGTPVETD